MQVAEVRVQEYGYSRLATAYLGFGPHSKISSKNPGILNKFPLLTLIIHWERAMLNFPDQLGNNFRDLKASTLPVFEKVAMTLKCSTFDKDIKWH